MLKGQFSRIHIAIFSAGFRMIFSEYKNTPMREFCRKYNISHHTAIKIFGPKMTRSKKRMVQILKNEGDERSVREIAGGNIM